MELPVEVNKSPRVARVVFAGKYDFGFLADWRKKLGDDQNPFRTDAVEFAQLAINRFSAHSAIQPYVKSVEDIGDHIANNSKCEVAGFVLLKCDWFPDSDVIGICHFRRTWCNNIILDYLAVHPFIAKQPRDYPLSVRGVGTALLYFLSRIAQQYSCGHIWGEATPISCGFYKKILLLDSVEDLILAPRNKFIEFADGLDLSWQNKSDTATTKAIAVEEVYKLEETNPPLVGNRSAMFSPPRRLAYHFLDLPQHIQMEIAQALGLLQDDDKGLRDDKLFRSLFRRATERGKLADLWSEVEKIHPEGEPGKNPFLIS